MLCYVWPVNDLECQYLPVSAAPAGLVENMSGFLCPSCGTVTRVFGEGGVQELAGEEGVEVLGGLGYSTEWTEEGALRWPASSPPPAPAPQVLLPDVGGAGAPEHRGGGVV